MKQSRLSFGTKRKDSPSSSSKIVDTNSTDVVEIIDVSDDSPKKSAAPPPKKVRRTEENEGISLSEVAKAPKSPARTSARRSSASSQADPVVGKSPAKLTPVKHSPAKTPSKKTPVKAVEGQHLGTTTPSSETMDTIPAEEAPVTPLAKRSRLAQDDSGNATPTRTIFKSPARASTRRSSANTPVTSDSMKTPAKASPSKESPVTTPSDQTPIMTPSKQTPTRARSKEGSSTSTPGSTPTSESSSTTPSSQNKDSSPRRTPGRTPRRSKTEIAYLELAKRKDQELRLKDKEEKMKQKEIENKKREEERLRREQEKKEAKERKEQERVEKEKKREAERLEKERRKEEERVEKERDREEKERLRKEKERKKEEERLEKEREREEKEKLRKEKEDERRKKEDERRREQEEEEAKKEKAKQAFKSFFVVKTTLGKGLAGGGSAEACGPGGPEELGGDGAITGADDGIGGGSSLAGSGLGGGAAGGFGSGVGPAKFKPFQLRKDMELAAIVPPAARARFDRGQIDEIVGSLLGTSGTAEVETQPSEATKSVNTAHEESANTMEIANGERRSESNLLYLEALKRTDYRPLKTTKRDTRKQEENMDCFIVQAGRSANDQESAAGGRMRAKLLQFVENFRPAYYGTWRKTCPQITGRRPFSKYGDFDYSVDSDDEWEDVEGEGESLVGTDDEKDKEENGEDDYEEDDFFVPHGYLSESEEEEADDQPLDPEALKARIVARQEEFKEERKAGFQTKKMVAVCAVARDGRYLEAEYQILQQFKALLLVASRDCPLKPSWERESDVISTPRNNKEHLEPKILTDEALKVFCETAHGFRSGVRQLYEEFYKKWRAVSDVKINLQSLKLTLTGTCRRRSKNHSLVVNKDLVERFGLKELDNDSPEEGTLSFPGKLLPEEVLADLIKVAHGTTSTSQVIMEFLSQMKGSQFGKAQVKRTLRTIAVFDHVHCRWLVKPELLKAHDLDELNKRIKTEEKPAKEKKDTQRKEAKEAAEEDGTASTSSKDQNLRSGVGQQDSNSKDSSTGDAKGKENITKVSTPKSMSIKKFFSTSSKNNGSPTSSLTPTVEGTPKAKKRIQLTTLSRTATMKQDSKPQAVLSPEEVMVIDDDE